MMKKISGYTLIEMLVVLGIAALVFGVSFASFTNFNKGRNLEAAANEVAVALRDAQHRAMSGEIDRSSGRCDAVDFSLGYWYIKWGENSNTYSLRLYCKCNSGGSCAADNDVEINKYSLKNNITTITNSPPKGDQTILFYPLLGTTNGGTVSITSSGSTYDISVDPNGGQIKVAKQ